MSSLSAADAILARRHRFHWLETLPWLTAIAAYFIFPGFLQLGAQAFSMILFALSLDLILGYAGIISLGHAAMFGAGAYAAGILSAHGGWNEPITGLAVGAAAAAVFAYLSGWFILRTKGLTLLMLTMAATIMLQEFANEQDEITGGDDGLTGILIDPVLGIFEFDLEGRTAYLYSLAVLFVMFILVRRIIHSPFGQTLRGIRENTDRMRAIGTPVRGDLLRIYTIAGAIAGVAGALLAQTTEFVALDTLSFERAGDVLIVIILGGSGRLYGAFIGAPVFMILQDQLAKLSPEYWQLGIGILLVLTVMYARRGLLGIFEDVSGWIKRRKGPSDG